MAERLEKRIDHQSDQQHAGSVPEIRFLDTVAFPTDPRPHCQSQSPMPAISRDLDVWYSCAWLGRGHHRKPHQSQCLDEQRTSWFGQDLGPVLRFL
jgi:hypothetical protein